MLVGMLKNSALYNPLRRMELVSSRRNVVLGQMQNTVSSPRSIRLLKALPISLSYQRVSHDEGSAPYFREILEQSSRRF